MRSTGEEVSKYFTTFLLLLKNYRGANLLLYYYFSLSITPQNMQTTQYTSHSLHEMIALFFVWAYVLIRTDFVDDKMNLLPLGCTENSGTTTRPPHQKRAHERIQSSGLYKTGFFAKMWQVLHVQNRIWAFWKMCRFVYPNSSGRTPCLLCKATGAPKCKDSVLLSARPALPASRAWTLAWGICVCSHTRVGHGLVCRGLG